MATSSDQVNIFQCSKCQNSLDMASKTLTCFHSLCGRCLTEEFKGETSGNCPECQEISTIDQLTLTPFLLSSLKRQRFESTELKCDVCLEGGDESVAKIWCKDCDKFLCEKCNQVHKSLLRNHNFVKFDAKGKDEFQKDMRTDFCNKHKMFKECYCDTCNVCLCDTCYKMHLYESPQCPSPPISVREEALKKKTSQGPTLLQEMKELKTNLEKRNQKFRKYSEELERGCDLKCEELWERYEAILEKLRERMIEMCEECRSLKKEKLNSWKKRIEKNEKLIKKLEMLCLNLQHLLKENEKNKTEMICGVEMIRNKFSSSSIHHPNQEMRKFELKVKVSDFLLKFMEKVENEKIASVSWINSDNLILFENEWNLPESNTDRSIHSIVVSQKDSHIFVADFENKSIIEFSQIGELISEFILIYKGKEFFPREMVLTSLEILWVNCGGRNWGEEEKIFLLERINFPPFLKIKQIIDKKKQNFRDSFSVCRLKQTILICNAKKLQIDFYTENGEYKKTIDTGESAGGGLFPLIRADPSTGNFWGVIPGTCKIFCFDQNGQKIDSIQTEQEIWNFYKNEFDNFYFCDLEGILSFLTEKYLHKFHKKSEKCPRIFVSNEKIFVCLKIDGKDLIQIFKILD